MEGLQEGRTYTNDKAELVAWRDTKEIRVRLVLCFFAPFALKNCSSLSREAKIQRSRVLVNVLIKCDFSSDQFVKILLLSLYHENTFSVFKMLMVRANNDNNSAWEQFWELSLYH